MVAKESGKQSRQRNSRKPPVTVSATLFATAVAVLMMLTPTSGSIVGPIVVLAPSYKNTATTPSNSWSATGCAKASAIPPHWTPGTGMITGAVASSSKTCSKTLGLLGGSSSSYAGDGSTVAIPLRVASSGNHTIATSVSFTVAASSTLTYPYCPNVTVAYPPPNNTNEYGYCEASAPFAMSMDVTVIDLGNSSWGSNTSYVIAFNYSYVQNYTDCYNYGTPYCSNISVAHSGGSERYRNVAGFIYAFTWKGTTNWTMWTNGTNMVRSHHYALILTLSFTASSYADFYHTVRPWTASASTRMDLSTLGKGARINSITVR